jgi:hypothetical protein
MPYAFETSSHKVLGLGRCRLIMSCSVAEFPDIFGVVFGESLVFTIPVR